MYGLTKTGVPGAMRQLSASAPACCRKLSRRLSVPAGIEVHRVNGDLARQRVGGQLLVRGERNRRHDEVPSPRGAIGRGLPSALPKLVSESDECSWPARVAEHDVKPGFDGEASHDLSEVADADQSKDSVHRGTAVTQRGRHGWRENGSVR